MLAFLLIGFKCIREASTDLCFSEVNDFVKCTISSLEKLIGGEHLMLQLDWPMLSFL